MRILLVNTNRMRPPVAPIGLDYVDDCLRAAGHQTRLLDLCFESDADAGIAASVAAFRPDAVGLSVRNTDDCYFSSGEFFLPGIRGLIDAFRRASSAPIIMGGVGFSVMPEAALRFCGADFGIAGEGEEAFPALLEAISSGAGFERVPGLLCREEDGFRVNPPAAAALDRLPARTRSLADNPRYFREGGQAGFETKRGCSMACIYCADPVSKGRRVRLRPPRMVAEELRRLLSMGIDAFHTCDCEFNLPLDHAREVCAAIMEAGLAERIRWYAYCSVVPFDAETAAVFRRAGCAGIDFGADSGNNGMLKRLGRDFRADDLARTAACCRAAGIPFMYDLLIGGPGETRESARETIEFVKRIGPDCAGISLGVRIYDGTPLGAEVRGQGPLEKNPALHGATQDNPDFMRPLFFISPELGSGIEGIVRGFVGGDRRFFLPDPREEGNYNYNGNDALVRAIAAGERGAYWDMLRKNN
jgi:tryptophan 2-C-methyltransferase